MKTLSLCFVLFCSLLAGSAAAQTVNMTVYPYGGNGPANLVSNAVPFKPGVLFDAINIRVLDGTTEVPVAAKVLARWPQDNSIRSVLLQFSASFSTASKNYTLQIGTARQTADRPFTTVTWDLPTRIFTLPASYLGDSLVFWEQKPLGQSGFSAWDNKQLSNYRLIETVGTAACVRDDNYYDATTTTYQLYARTGQLKYLVNARKWALHHRRDQVYLSGTSIGHPRCSGAYLNNTRYTFPQALVSDYFMFGDEEAKRVSGIIVDNFYMRHGDNFYYKAPNTRGWFTEREPAFALIGILAHYQATGNTIYLDKIKQRMTSLHRMQVENNRRAWVHNLYDHDPSEGCATSDYGSSPWMSGLLLEAIVEYHKLTGDPTARESILMALDDIKARYLATGTYRGVSFVYLGCSAWPNGTPDLDNLISHAFGYGYKLTGRTDYLTVGRNIFNTSVASGVTASHKHYDQQFRSSGRFVAYVTGGSSTTPTDPPPPTGSDTTAPTLSVTPLPAVVGGVITITANATDNVGVAGVQFIIDGTASGGEDTSAPWAVEVNTDLLSSGSHTVTARARDAAGNRTTSAGVSFIVDNGMPAISITSPTAGATLSGTFTASATATDRNAIAGVQFVIDNQPQGAEDTAAPYSAAVNTGALTSGSHTLTAVARDVAGNKGTASVTFNTSGGGVVGDTIAPTVTVGALPAVLGGVISLTASATDNVGVTGVQFVIDGTAWGAEDTAAPYAVSCNTDLLRSGSHTLTARARDAAGNTRISTGVSFIVDNGMPAVTITSPAAGATVGSSFTAAASVTDRNAIAGVQFLIDNRPYGAEDTSAPFSVAVNASSLTSGSHTLAAVARDIAGNRGTASITFRSSGGSDTTAPTASVNALPDVVGGVIALSANATDNVGVTGVQFLIDGTAWGAEDTSAPFSVVCSTDLLRSGSHILTAQARDAAGNRATSAGESFVVDNGIPAVAITSPAAGATVGANFTAAATVTDRNTIAGVQFLIDNQSYGAEDTSAPFSVAVNAGALTSGSHTLSALARDIAGNKGTGSVTFVAGSGTGGGTAGKVTITVYPYAGNGPANLVSNALPFKPGVVFDAINVRVLDGTTEVPVAAKVLAKWPQDNSVRSVLLQFSSSFSTASKTYTVEIGTPRRTADRQFTAVTWDLPTRIFTLPASYLSDSLVFWEQKPLGETGFPAWDTKQIANYGRIETIGTAACVRDDNYYDSTSSTYQLYARTGQLKYLVNARKWALHHRRDQIYLSGTYVGHPKCSGAYLGNTRYTFPEALISDYFMFGDEEAKRVSGLVVDNFYMPHADKFYYQAPNTTGFWTEREPAFALQGILAHYEATGNAVYLNKVKERMASLHKMQVDNGRRAWLHDVGSCNGVSPWMTGLLLEAIIKYHKLTNDPIARDSILMALDDMKARYMATRNYAGVSFVYLSCASYVDGLPDLDNIISHAFGYGYKITGRSDYLKVGTDIFNTSVRSGVTASHKHYNQQFRSSGHFVEYVSPAN